MPVIPADAEIPDRDDVLGQAIPFDRDRWLRLLPGPVWWPAELDECPKVAGRPRVDRSTVLRAGCVVIAGIVSLGDRRRSLMLRPSTHAFHALR